jgi:hypothetical protein
MLVGMFGSKRGRLRAEYRAQEEDNEQRSTDATLPEHWEIPVLHG